MSNKIIAMSEAAAERTYDERLVELFGFKMGPDTCSFALGYCGAEAVLAACRSLVARGVGSTETFLIAGHPRGANPYVYDVVRVGLETGPRFRYCGEAGRPDGAGSYGLGSGDNDDPALAAVALAMDLCRRSHRFVTDPHPVHGVTPTPLWIFRVVQGK